MQHRALTAKPFQSRRGAQVHQGKAGDDADRDL